jgi:hypothetical protein
MTIARLAILLLMPGAMLAGALAAQVPPPQAAQPAPHSATVALTGEAQWVPTNIEVAEGDRLVLQARGMQISDSVSLDPAGRPDGAGIERPAPDAPYAAVIGRIGGGPPFLVGASYDRAAPASGMLELGINAFMRQGRTAARPLFEVTVEHVPQPPPPDPQPDPANILDDAANVLENQGNGLDPGAGNVVAGNPQNAVQPIGPGGGEPGTGWLVPLLIGAGGMLALLLVGRLVKHGLRPKQLPALSVGVHPSLDREEGAVTGDEIALTGPEVRLRTALELGGTFFEGDGPVVEREELDG